MIRLRRRQIDNLYRLETKPNASALFTTKPFYSEAKIEKEWTYFVQIKQERQSMGWNAGVTTERGTLSVTSVAA